ncbi:MAG: dephospho-CoA kinase [Nanoarchaeota archaeon]|nr:dephospho-CoA kinase [Nanoarchaeota archaeon]
MIIGLTGTIASGKSEIAKILKDKGFEHHTYSDILREEAKKQNIQPTRENLQRLGNKIKEESKNLGILSKLIIENSKSGNIIADGIRTVDEIKELKKYPHAYVIGIGAPQNLRFERMKSRKRAGDPLTFEQFKEIDDHENKGLTKGQDINNCLKKADFTIINDGSFENLKNNIHKILKKINA